MPARIISALLCDFAQVREGLLFMSSGGVTRLFRQSLPAPMGVMLAVVIEIEPDEIFEPHELKVTICENDNATQIGTVSAAMQLGEAQGHHPGESLQFPFVLDLRGAGVGAWGAHDLRVSIDDGESEIRTFYVSPPPT